MTVSIQLRTAIKASGETRYRIAKETGVDSRTLDRFLAGNHIRSDTIDVLCDYLGLHLAPEKQGGKKAKTGRKKASKKR